MDFVIICGPPASGKMTVGQELKKLTEFKLLHNHMSLELVHQFFDFGTPNFKRLDKKIRFDIFDEVSKSDIKGLIFTFVWAFSEKEDEEYVQDIINKLERRNPKVHIIELDCELAERLRRNKGENRLKNKPSKRDIEASEKRLLENDKKYRMNSIADEQIGRKIIKIRNTNMTAKEVAEKIINECHLNKTNK